jgi:hypothetical protein
MSHPSFTCKHCGTTAPAKVGTRGSMGIELILWLCFLVPGLVYSLWRMSSRYWQCPACGGDQLVPPDSPEGKRIRSEA